MKKAHKAYAKNLEVQDSSGTTNTICKTEKWDRETLRKTFRKFYIMKPKNWNLWTRTACNASAGSLGTSQNQAKGVSGLALYYRYIKNKDIFEDKACVRSPRLRKTKIEQKIGPRNL